MYVCVCVYADFTFFFYVKKNMNIDALRREVKKLLVQLQDQSLRENELEEQAVSLKERLRYPDLQKRPIES